MTEPEREDTLAIVFGPVPSRRLGRSLGIGNVAPKTCSYSCIYCQVGPTPAAEIEPRTCWPPSMIVERVTRRVQMLRERGEPIDFLTFVPDGEPTLDANLGKEDRRNNVVVLEETGGMNAIALQTDRGPRRDLRGFRSSASREGIDRNGNPP